ncbi:uncharacterized protein LOC124663809 [Lolium rigidum]|uniref:uncharacterized protein LOC124663809 n=1 Tax=Lolium rigidum TaxID=89674 RepID=UPI001F5C21B2|nr:uncharacterized protein LOC124663809 [Lolium rigidum]
MASLLRMLLARYRESVLGRPYGGVPGGDGARRGARGPRSGRASGGDAAGRGRSREGRRADSAGGGRRQRQRGDDGRAAESESSGEQERSFWSRIRERLRGTNSSDIREAFEDLEANVEMLEKLEGMPGRVYNLAKKIQEHMVTAGVSLGAGAILLKGKLQDTFASVKEKVSSVKETVMDRLSPKKVRPALEGDDASTNYPAPGPLDFSM